MSPHNVEPNGCPHPQHSDYSSCPRGTMHCWRAPICAREASRIPAAFHGLWRVAQWLGTEEAEDVCASIRIRAKVAAHREALNRHLFHGRPDLRNVDLEDGGIHRIT